MPSTFPAFIWDPMHLSWDDTSQLSTRSFNFARTRLAVQFFGAQAQLAFAKLLGSDYAMSIRISQPVWEGGVGLFYGYGQRTTNAGTFTFFQVVTLEKNGSGEFQVARYKYRISNTGAQVLTLGTPHVLKHAPLPAEEYTLVLRRGQIDANAGLVEASWNGIDLVSLVNAGANAGLQAVEYNGLAGIMQMTGAATYRFFYFAI